MDTSHEMQNAGEKRREMCGDALHVYRHYGTCLIISIIIIIATISYTLSLQLLV